jgi:hypothetical protein
MSKSNVEQIVGKLIIDADFRQAVKANPGQVLAAYDLTPEERETLSQIDLGTFEEAATQLDARISKMAA